MDVITEVFIFDAKMQARENRHLVNLPHYQCRCNPQLKYFCPICLGRGWLTYNEALKSYGIDSLPLGLQLPQCHICTRFETEDNPLFAYSYLERNNEFKFIYRCQNGHPHDHGMTVLDILTGLEVYL
jgi:hypothetical protein